MLTIGPRAIAIITKSIRRAILALDGWWNGLLGAKQRINYAPEVLSHCDLLALHNLYANRNVVS